VGNISIVGTTQAQFLKFSKKEEDKKPTYVYREK